MALDERAEDLAGVRLLHELHVRRKEVTHEEGHRKVFETPSSRALAGKYLLENWMSDDAASGQRAVDRREVARFLGVHGGARVSLT